MLKLRFVAEMLRFVSEEAGTYRVESADPNFVCQITNQVSYALAHLTGRLIGERYGENVPRGYALLLYEMGNPIGQDAGLARSGTG